MSRTRSYLLAAFNARPLGMPLPPNWLVLAAFALAGALVDPGLWLIGLGLEGLYVWALANNARFRATVDVGDGESSWHSRYAALSEPLDEAARARQASLEQQTVEIESLLARTGAHTAQMGDVRKMAWLHLKLLAARAAVLQVIAAAGRERPALAEQERRANERLSRGVLGEDLQRSLEQQLAVLRSRRLAHDDAERRRELIDAELERLCQQVSLVREQALLATDEHSAAASLDALSASLNEANRWLKEQRELFAGLDELTDEPPPAGLPGRRPAAARRREARAASE